ncbi:MAG: hypothetical protein JSV56_10835, partial [Methanomassiliicoccales archaeon]
RKNVSSKDALLKIEPWLTVFKDNEGILRCVHSARDEAIKLLKSIEVVGRDSIKIKVEPLGTSGTIKKAKMRYLGSRR